MARARDRGDTERAQRWANLHVALANALQTHAWDGHWYRRAYFDNGNPLGAQANAECSIDLIAQAWSVFASPPGDLRALDAMASADARLVDRRHRLVRLLDPPLHSAIDHAGYIQAYPPGVRENGGQYSHAGVWALMAQAQLGHAQQAWDYFCMLSAAHRTPTDADKNHYRLEPYVMAGDTYSAAPYAGQGGWSWYTGAAAWMQRASLESILGLALRADALRLTPCLPPHWSHAEVELRLRGKHLRVVLHGPGEAPPDAVVVREGEWVNLAALPQEGVVWVPGPRVTPAAPAPQ
jgi:cyclic beta-1,2-glucan synthetase